MTIQVSISFLIFFKVYLLKWSSHQLTVRNMIGFGSLNTLAMPCLFWSWLFSLLWFSSIHGCGKCSIYSVATLRFASWYDTICVNTGYLKVALSQKVQDSFFIANFVTINIPFFFPKLLHPLHSIDKMSIFKTFTFTCLLYLQAPEVGFISSTNNFIS